MDRKLLQDSHNYNPTYKVLPDPSEHKGLAILNAYPVEICVVNPGMKSLVGLNAEHTFRDMFLSGDDCGGGNGPAGEIIFSFRNGPLRWDVTFASDAQRVSPVKIR